MRPYFELMKRSFLGRRAYKLELLLGVLTSFASVFVVVALWRALYAAGGEPRGISLSAVTTYAVVSMGMRTAFMMNEFTLERKVLTGEIVVDLLRPISIPLSLLSSTVANSAFNLIGQAVPTFVIAVILFHIPLPRTLLAGTLFLASVVLGFLLLFSFSLNFWALTFWLERTYSVITIKNSLVALTSGLLLPLWFVPKELIGLFNTLPFQYVYFAPISLYLGRLSPSMAIHAFVLQIVWLAVFSTSAWLIWKAGVKNLIVNGG